MYQYSIEGEEPMTALDAERLAQGMNVLYLCPGEILTPIFGRDLF